jgi:hypothetical protein
VNRTPVFAPTAVLLALAVLVSFGAPLGCAKKEEVIAKTAADKELTAPDIDRDPLALLPGGAVGVLYLDMERLFASEFGAKLLAISERQLPLPKAAGFEPRRDLKKVYVGSYSMKGVDVAGVAIGAFDIAKIEAAADGIETTPLGVPLTKTRYANRALYTAQDVGFTVLTAKTALFGNQTGIRRALDRIKEGRAQREVPRWLVKMLDKSNAPLIGALDLKAQPVPDALSRNLAFLEQLQTAAVVGNFEPPGLNLAGTLTYPNAEAAERGAGNLRRAQEMLNSYGWVMAILGIAQPLRKLEVQAKDKETAFVAGVDAKAVGSLLEMAQNWLPRPSTTAVKPNPSP